MRSSDHFVPGANSPKRSVDKTKHIYTTQFTDILNSLKQSIEYLSKKQFNTNEFSAYSAQMLQKAMSIINLLLNNNDIDYWINKSNRKQLRELFDILDQSKGTLVSEVFNEHSLELAVIIFGIVKSLQQQNILNMILPQARQMVAEQLGNTSDFINSMCAYLEANIEFYSALKQNDLFQNAKLETQNAIKAFYSNCHTLIKDIKPNTFNVFFKEYINTVKFLIEIITRQPYFTLNNATKWINQATPFVFEGKDINLIDVRRELICQLIQEEQKLNLALQGAHLPLLTTVYDAYQSNYDQEEQDSLSNKLAILIQSLQQKAEKYKTGEHLTFGWVDGDKVAALDKLLTNVRSITESKNNQLDLAGKCLLLYKHSLDTAKENFDIANRKEKPLGEFSKLVNSAALRFFAIVFFELSETNDMRIRAVLDEAGNLYREPQIDLQASTKISQKEANRFLTNAINHLRCKMTDIKFPVCDQMIVALLQHADCNGELIRNNKKFFKDLLPDTRFERIVREQLRKPHENKIVNAQFWRNYLAVLSCDVINGYVKNGHKGDQLIPQSPNRSVNQRFTTSVDSPMKSSQQKEASDIRDRCFEYISVLANANISGFLTADSIVSLLMLYQNTFEDIIEAHFNNKFELLIETLNYIASQKLAAEHFVAILHSSIQKHLEKLIISHENNMSILYMLLTLDSSSKVDSSMDGKNAEVKKLITAELDKKPAILIKILKMFGNDLIQASVDTGEIIQNENSLLDRNYIVFGSLLAHIELCRQQLTAQDLYCLAHNKRLFQLIIETPLYLAILLQHDKCDELLNFEELATRLSISIRALTPSEFNLRNVQLCHIDPNYVASLTPANLIKFIASHANLANLILSDLNGMAKLLKSNEFGIPLIRKHQDKIIAYLSNTHHKSYIEEFSCDVYFKLLAAKIPFAKERLFSNIMVALKILNVKHNDAQFLEMVKNDYVKLFNQAEFCQKLDVVMLIALLAAFENEELPDEFALIAQHNPALIKHIGNRNLPKHWKLYEVIYSAQAREGTLSREQLIPIQQSSNPACREWLGSFYHASGTNKNIVRLMLNDATVIDVVRYFPLFRPLLENEPVTDADLDKFYEANSPEIDDVLAAPRCQQKTSVYLQNKFYNINLELGRQRVKLFAFLSSNKDFCAKNLVHLIKFFSKEGHTLNQVKSDLIVLCKEKPELIPDLLTFCDQAIVNHNIELFLPVLDKKNIRLNKDSLIKLSYSEHEAVSAYLYEDAANFECVKEYIPLDNAHLNRMLHTIKNMKGDHLLNNEKLAKHLLCRVNALFKDFPNNAQLLTLLFKLPQSAKLFEQMGPDDLYKLLTIDDEKLIQDVVVRYRDNLILMLALQQIRLNSANNNLIKVILLDEKLRNQFFSNAIASEQLQQQLYELYQRNNEMITQYLFDFHLGNLIGFQLCLLSGLQLKDLYFGQNNNFMLLAKNELFQNVYLRKVFLSALSADQRRQFLYDNLVKLNAIEVYDYFMVEADINWLCEGPQLFNLLLNNISFASYVLQQPQLREIFNLSSHHFFLVVRKCLNNAQQLLDFLSHWSDKQFITSIFIEAIQYGHIERILLILENKPILHCLDRDIVKGLLETVDLPYISWNKSKDGSACYEKLQRFCMANSIKLTPERDIIKSINNNCFDLDRHCWNLSKHSQALTGNQKRINELEVQLKLSITELNLSWNKTTIDVVNKRFEVLICLFELSQVSKVDRRTADQVGQFLKDLLAKNGLDETASATKIFNLLIKKCLVDSYHPGVLSLILSHNAKLINIALFNGNKKLALEFLFNPLLCQHLSAPAIAAIVKGDHNLAISCFAHPTIFSILLKNHDELVAVAKLAGIVAVEDGNDKAFQRLKEISALIACEADLFKVYPELLPPPVNNHDLLRISSPVVHAVTTMGILRTVSAPTFPTGNSSPNAAQASSTPPPSSSKTSQATPRGKESPAEKDVTRSRTDSNVSGKKSSP